MSAVEESTTRLDALSTTNPPLLDKLQTANEISLTGIVNTIKLVYEKTGILDFTPLLPFLFTLKGKPYTLVNHFPMEPLMRFSQMPRRLLLKCGRQVSKSQTVSARLLLMSLCQDYLQTLVVLPRFEQARRLSSNYVAPFMLESPIKHLFMQKNFSSSVLQRTLPNNSTIHFSYAFLSEDKVRGIPSDNNVYDEVQDIDINFIPVIRECLSASDLKLETYSGTPKSHDNTIQALWEDTSQAEFVIKCLACNHYNIPAKDHDILGMIGKTTLVCAKCEKDIDAKNGHWVHAFPDRRHLFAGYHIPQIIMPMNYSNPDNWFIMREKEKYTQNKFWNECLGESFDIGTRLFTLDNLKANANLEWECIPESKEKYIYAAQTVRNMRSRYLKVAMGVDWGGGGVDEISLTAAVIVGVRPGSANLEIIWMDCWPSLGQEEQEAKKIFHMSRDFNVDVFAHDFGGAGVLRETLILQAGFDPRQIMPCVYVARRSESSPIVLYHGSSQQEGRAYYQIDKARSLTLLSLMAKANGLRFPKYQSVEKMLEHFMSLYYERTESSRVSEITLVRRSGKRPDDIANAANLAAMSLFHTTGYWPDLAKSLQVL